MHFFPARCQSSRQHARRRRCLSRHALYTEKTTARSLPLAGKLGNAISRQEQRQRQSAAACKEDKICRRGGGGQ
jgi:hypothetical protein